MDSVVTVYKFRNKFKFLIVFILTLHVLPIDAVFQNVCTKVEDNCIGSIWECSRSIPCVHGECDSRGSCSCYACWHGENCNQYTDDHPPQFLVKSKYISLHPSDSGILFMADAYDADLALTCPYDTPACLCASLQYSFLAGNEENIFDINKETGAVSRISGAELIPGKEYKMKIKVSGHQLSENETHDYQMFDFLTVILNVANDTDVDDVEDNDKFLLTDELFESMLNSTDALKRKKRSVGTEPKNTVLTLTQEAPETGNLTLGNQGTYKFEILLPQIDEMELTVEIFTEDPETKNTSLILCQLKVESAGSKLTSNKGEFTDVKPEFTKNKEDRNIRAIFDFGKVSSTEGQDSNSSGIITITFVAVLVRNEDLAKDKTYYVAAGAKYNNDDFVWVSHAEITPIIPDNFDQPYPSNFEMYGPSELQEEKAGIYNIMAYISHPDAHLFMDVFSPKDEMIDYYSVGNIRLLNSGENFPCLQEDKLSYTLYFNDSETENSKYLGVLDLGKILNCDNVRKKANDSLNRLEFEVAIYPLRGAKDLDDSQLFFAVGMMIGEQILWSGIVNITIMEFEETDEGDAPKIITISPLDDVKIPEEGIAIVQFRIEYKDNQFYKTKLEISVSDKDTMSLCKVSLIYRGFNIPYIPKFIHEFTHDAETNISESVVIDLGRIQTTGQLPENETANSIIIEVGVRAVKAFSDGTVTLQVGDMKNVSGKISTEKIDSAQELYNIMLDKVISSNILFATAETSINIEVELNENSFFEPFSIEVMGSFGNNTAAAKICRTEVVYTGRLLPCVNKTVINEATYYDKTNESLKVYDRGIMPFGRVCTATPFGDKEILDRRMIVNFVVELPPQDEISNGDIYWLNAGIQHGSFGATVGSVQYTIGDEDMSIEEGCEPVFTMKQQSEEAIGVGSSFYLLFRIKLPSRSRAKYKLTIESKSDGASICKIAFIHVGHNMPCLDTKTFPGKLDMYSTTWLNYELFLNDPENRNNKAIIDFGSLANTGNQPLMINDKDDGNTLYIGAPILINADDSAGHKIAYVWDINNKNIISNETIIKVGPEVTVEEKINATIGTLDGNMNIYNKVTKLIYVDIQIPKGFIGTINATFEDKDQTEKVTFCSGSLTHIGFNLPCINASIIEPEPSPLEPPSECSSRLSVNIGKICHSMTFPELDASRIRVEIAINAVEDLADDITIVAKIDTSSPPEDQTITLRPTSDEFAPIRKLSNDSVCLSSEKEIEIPVSQKEWIGINITIPLNTTVPFKIMAIGEAEDPRAIVTIYDIRLAVAGVNLRCMRNLTFIKKTFEKENVTKYSQQNKLIADFGYVTNLGFTYRRNDYRESDDNLIVQVQVRMTDHPKVEADVKFKVKFIVQSDDMETELNQVLVAKRYGNETAEIEMELVINDTKEYNKGDEIPAAIILRLTNTSALEPDKIMIRFLLPPFVVYKDFNSNNSDLKKSDVSYVQFDFTEFLYDDVYELNLILDVDPKGIRPAGSPATSFTMISRSICTVIPRAGLEYEKGYHFCSDSEVTSFKIGAADCNGVLGKKSETLQDCQFSASSAMDKDNTPQAAEVGQDTCWSPAFRYGLKNEYYQVDFGNTAIIKEIQIEKCSENTEAITKYKVSESSNGKVWKNDKDFEAEYKDNLHISAISTKTRFIRIAIVEPSTPEKPIGAKFEFIGCTTGPIPSPAAICKANPETLLTDDATKYRHFTCGVDDSLYMCDYSHKKKKLNCFCSVNQGKSWKALPAYIGSLLGFNKEKGFICASDKKGRSKMKTKDCLKWEVAKKEDCNNMENSISVPAYPPDKLQDLKCGQWTADVNGLKHDGKLKLSWKECCRN